MRILLDTHVALWTLLEPERLTSEIAALVGDPTNEIFVSSVSLAEIAIKRSLGRVSFESIRVGVEEAQDALRRAGFSFLDFSPEHAIALERLPLHHRDPFDRMLICQALEEPMRLITHDALVASYSDTIIHF